MKDNPNNHTPQHVAVIMDGNGRWAKKRGLERTEGHAEGVRAVRRLLDVAVESGVKVLTLYTFSEENWNRPAEEVSALMNLLVKTIHKELPELKEKKIHLRMIGETDRIPEEPRKTLLSAMEETDIEEPRLQLVLALNYSAKSELVHAFNILRATKGAQEKITADDISRNLYAPDLPSPDLLIRTGGELRLSNFLLWQLAYTELYFTDCFWPDFSEEDFRKALEDYAGRQRRFGRTGEQITASGEK